MSPFNNILNNFDPISLNQMDGVELLNRTDTKFVFHSKRLLHLLTHAQQYYKVLDIRSERDFAYSNTYMDTNNFLFFNQQMSGRPKRYKVRHRTYVSSGLAFLKVKCKTNQDRTIKWRIKHTFDNEMLDAPALTFLEQHINNNAYCINPVLVNKFQRITLVGMETKERITIDYNLSFTSNEKQIVLPYLSIAELKREGYGGESPFLSILKKMNVHKTGFSKYCVGNALLRPMPKINLLKYSLLQLKKLENDRTVYSAI
jgi:hypothetical protein